MVIVDFWNMPRILWSTTEYSSKRNQRFPATVSAGVH